MLEETELRALAAHGLERVVDGLRMGTDEGREASDAADPGMLERLAWTRFWRLANRAFRRSHMGLATAVAYIQLRRVEVANLITVCEGIRAGIPARQLTSGSFRSGCRRRFMFRSAAMMRLSAVVLARHERSVLRALGRLGAVQLTRTAAGDGTAPINPRDRTSELARCDRLLGRIAQIRRSLGIAGAAGASVKPMRFEDASQSSPVLGKTHRRLGAAPPTVSAGRAVAGHLRAGQPYRSLELPGTDSPPSSFLHFVTGNLPQR